MKPEEYEEIRMIVRSEIREAIADFMRDATLAMKEVLKQKVGQ